MTSLSPHYALRQRLISRLVGIVRFMQQSPSSPQSHSVSASAFDSAAQLSNLQQTYTVIPRVRPETPLLDGIATPSDLNDFTTAQLITLADELRLFCCIQQDKAAGTLVPI
ncbi:hypothetical protein Psyaliredsea_03680 [Psychrobacter alimentarius]